MSGQRVLERPWESWKWALSFLSYHIKILFIITGEHEAQPASPWELSSPQTHFERQVSNFIPSIGCRLVQAQHRALLLATDLRYSQLRREAALAQPLGWVFGRQHSLRQLPSKMAVAAPHRSPFSHRRREPGLALSAVLRCSAGFGPPSSLPEDRRVSYWRFLVYIKDCQRKIFFFDTVKACCTRDVSEEGKNLPCTQQSHCAHCDKCCDWWGWLTIVCILTATTEWDKTKCGEPLWQNKIAEGLSELTPGFLLSPTRNVWPQIWVCWQIVHKCWGWMGAYTFASSTKENQL